MMEFIFNNPNNTLSIKIKTSFKMNVNHTCLMVALHEALIIILLAQTFVYISIEKY